MAVRGPLSHWQQFGSTPIPLSPPPLSSDLNAHSNVFERQPKSDEHVALLAAYCRREVAALNKVPIVDVYAGLIPWGPAVGERREGASGC